MDQEFKAKWVAALRSGKYVQGKGALAKDGRFCCLGVAADLLAPDRWRSSPDGTKINQEVHDLDENKETVNIEQLSKDACERIDLPVEAQEVLYNLNDGGERTTFAYLLGIEVDGYSHSFEYIANIIEEKL